MSVTWAMLNSISLIVMAVVFAHHSYQDHKDLKKIYEEMKRGQDKQRHSTDNG